MPTGLFFELEETRIIPEMNISCNGTLSGWTVAGRNLTTPTNNNSFPKLKVFRETSANSRMYSFIGEVVLGTCGSGFALTNAEGFFTCDLEEQDRLPVQANDVIGFYFPEQSVSTFQVRFNTSPTDPINTVFMGVDINYDITIPIGKATARNLPQINLDIATGMYLHVISYILHS